VVGSQPERSTIPLAVFRQPRPYGFITAKRVAPSAYLEGVVVIVRFHERISVFAVKMRLKEGKAFDYAPQICCCSLATDSFVRADKLLVRRLAWPVCLKEILETAVIYHTLCRYDAYHDLQLGWKAKEIG